VDENNKSKGITELIYIDPINIKKIKKYIRKMENNVEIISGVEEFYMYSKNAFAAPNIARTTGNADGVRINPEAICFVGSGLYDASTNRVVGYLNKAIKAVNQLQMMEDSIVIYRMSRAPERRIFYVDVGNLPANRAEQYMKDLINRYRNRLIYNSATGEVVDERRHLSMLEDYWLPRREGGRGTEVTTLAGAQNLGELKDLEYFLRKLYKSLSVPYSRMEGGEAKSFSIGRSTEISRDEIKFAKFITRLRTKFSEVFYTLLKTHLILKGIIDEKDWLKEKQNIWFDFIKDSYFSELKQYEILNERLNTVMMMDPYIGRFYSEKWIMLNVLGFNEREIEAMKLQMDLEKEIKSSDEINNQIDQTETDKALNPDMGMDPNNPQPNDQMPPPQPEPKQDPLPDVKDIPKL
jgi:predicted transcriptional regulator